MKQRIDLAVLLLVLGASSFAMAQQPPQNPPSETPPSSAAPPDDGLPSEEEPSESAAPDEGGAQTPSPDVSPGAAAAAAPETATEEAPAEEAPAEEAAPVSGGAEEIVVTGSRIKQASSFNAAAPVQIIDRKQLEYTGVTNMADVVQYLTVAQGSGFQGQTGAPGTTSINLRGLGAGATLVLLNGRRLPTSGGGADQEFADISTIPLSAVERIEILKGGASAIYGSDAIGGVVNIITRKKLDGVRIEGDTGATARFDQKSGQISGAFGANSERGRVMLAMSYGRQTELLAKDRTWAKGGALISTQGQPGSYIVGTGVVPDPDCMKGPFSSMAGTPGNIVCGYNIRDYTFLLGAGEQATALGTAEFDLTKHTTAYAELNVARLRSAGSFAAFPIPPPFPTVPANHVDNPFGQAVQFIGRPFGAEDGHVKNSADDDTFRVLGGIKGDFADVGSGSIFESWEWDLSASFGQSRFRNLVNDTLRPEFNTALNSCSDPANLKNCFNPFYSAWLGTGTPNSNSVNHSILGQYENLTEHALQTYNAGMTGNLFELPGGDVGLAFGAELRHEWRASDSDHDANQYNYAFIVGNPDALAKRSIYSGYIEMRWPFYDGIEMQTAARAEHYTDIDRTAVSPSAGLAITPSEIAGRDNVAPALRRLQFRFNATEAFRAPNIYQSFPGFYTLPQVFYPLGSPLPVFLPTQVHGNPALGPEHALVLSAGVQWAPVDELALMADFWDYDYKNRIEQENATQFYSDLQHQRMVGGPSYICPPDPHFVFDTSPGAQPCSVGQVNVKWINVPGSLITNGVDFGGVISITGATFGGSKEDFGTFSIANQSTYTLTYALPRSELSLDSIADGLKCDGTGPKAHCNVAGARNATNVGYSSPRLKMHFPVTWAFAGHTASVITHYTSSLIDDANAAASPGMVVPLGRIPSWTTFDLQYSYTIKEWIGKEFTIRIGMYNVFDAPPPRATGAGANALPYEPEIYDPRGRSLYAKLIAQF